jgi:hypothetical protein
MKIQTPKTQQETVELLKRRILESGLSVRQFAIQVMVREDRTVRRWLSGESPVPNMVVDWLVEPYAPPWPTRRRRKRRKS